MGKIESKMLQQPQQSIKVDMAEKLDALVAQEGTGAHSYILDGTLFADQNSQRNLADAAHYLSVLHGRYPGVIEHAVAKTTDSDARQWLNMAADAFSRERAYLTKLSVAVGPLPSTPGQAQCEAAVASQRHALDMLAQSDRKGCAIAAAITLTLEWRTIRAILDSAAQRLNITPPLCTLPDVRVTANLARATAQSEAIERAMYFGAQQILAQHRGLWDLLSAREEARRKV